MSLIRCAPAIFAIVAASMPGSAAAGEPLAGPYTAAVERVVDGDTLAVRVAIWIEQDLSVLVRIRGIDAPEVRGKCESEKEHAREATLALQELVAGGDVALTTIEGDKYFGRVIADVTTSAGESVGAALIASGHVRTYDGGERESWCGGGTVGSTDDPRGVGEIAIASP